MRIEVIEADGWRIEVRGRTRRTTALESDYLLMLKAAHPDMKGLPDEDGKVEDNPRGWSLAGVAANFRLLAARIRAAHFADSTVLMDEPFSGDQLVKLFEHYLDCDQLPDRSDLWSQVEDAILKMNRPTTSANPLSGSDTPSK